jgi:hypothetical protein
LNQEGKNNLSSSITSNEIETVVKNLPTKKSPGTDGFTAEFCQTFNVEPVFFKLFHKTQRKGILPNSFYQDSITVLPYYQNQVKTYQKKKKKKKKKKVNIHNEDRCKTPQ